MKKKISLIDVKFEQAGGLIRVKPVSVKAKNVFKKNVDKANQKGFEIFPKQQNQILAFLVSHDLVTSTDEPLKVTLHVKRLPRRNDSMFYYGKHIATLTKGRGTNKKRLIVESAGEMEMAFTPDGDALMGDELAKEMRKCKLTDRGLSALGSNDLILMNNWFRIVEVDVPETITMPEQIAHTYDDAIATAKNMLED